MNEGLDESSDFSELCYNIRENSEVEPYNVLSSYKNKESEIQDWRPLIKPVQYQNALRQYMQYGEAMRFPESVIDEWLHIIVTNTIRLESNTSLTGHSQWFPTDDFSDVYENEFEQWCFRNNVKVEYEYSTISKFLDEIGFMTG